MCYRIHFRTFAAHVSCFLWMILLLQSHSIRWKMHKEKEVCYCNNHFLFLSLVRVNKSGNNLIDYGERFSKISENWVISVIGATAWCWWWGLIYHQVSVPRITKWYFRPCLLDVYFDPKTGHVIWKYSLFINFW